MKKLTKAQESLQNDIKDLIITENKSLFFDIDNAILLGKGFRKELDELRESNRLIKEKQRSRCLADFNQLQAFLGDYKDLIVMNDEPLHEKGDLYFSFQVGNNVNDNLSIFFSYYYGKEYWNDSECTTKVINDEMYQIYDAEMLEVYSSSIGSNEEFNTLEDVFNDIDYSDILEKLVTELILTKV